MGFFSFLKRTNPNPKAQERPRDISDYRHASAKLTGRDSTSFATIDRIASEFAGLSYGIYNKRTNKEISNHPLYAVLARPNLEDLHFNFFYQSIVDYYNGGIMWKKGKGTEGQLVSLFRLSPQETAVTRDQFTRERIYLHNGHRYTDEAVLYIPSRFDYSTINGGSSIFKAANAAFDTAHKLDNYTNSAFDKGISGKRLVIDISNAILRSISS